MQINHRTTTTICAFPRSFPIWFRDLKSPHAHTARQHISWNELGNETLLRHNVPPRRVEFRQNVTSLSDEALEKVRQACELFLARVRQIALDPENMENADRMVALNFQLFDLSDQDDVEAFGLRALL